jgi:hypothetical protein
MSVKISRKKKDKNVALVDVLDRLLEKGVVAEGEVSIRLADVDLIFLQIQLLATSLSRVGNWQEDVRAHKQTKEEIDRDNAYIEKLDEAIKKTQEAIPKEISGNKAEDLEKGLARLVLTLVELIRRLMEREAVRQVRGQQLSTVQTQKLGMALKTLAVKMEVLKNTFDLDDEDLNIDLGPLGNLL